MIKKRKILSLLVCAAMMISLLPTAALAESQSIEEGCIHHPAHTEGCGWAAAREENACDKACTDVNGDGLTDHAEDCAYTPAVAEQPCGYQCTICPVQALIDALPGAEEVTAETADAVGAKLDEIDAAKAPLTDEERGGLDFAKYNAAIARLNELAGQPGAEQPVTPTAESVAYQDCDSNGQNWQAKTCYSATVVTPSTTSWPSGWYVVNGNVDIGTRISVSGDVHLILTDGCSLNAAKGIEISNSRSDSLTIYGQAGQTGVLTARAEGSNAGICVPPNASFTVKGGDITATGNASGYYAGAGIGGNYATHSGSITIHNGTIRATGASADWGGAAGIGGGGASSKATSITITGGDITAKGGENGAAGIGGGGHDGTLDSLSITGGCIKAEGHAATTNSSKQTANAIGGGAGHSAADLGRFCNNAVVQDLTAKTIAFYGDALNQDITVPADYTMTIPAEKTLTIPEGKTLTNNGTINNHGTINNNGSITNNGTINNYGTITGNAVSGNAVKESIKYLDSRGVEQSVLCDALITAANIGSYGTLNAGWYAVKGTLATDTRIEVNGAVRLILTDGCSLTANDGIHLAAGNSLTIYSQSAGSAMGELIAYNSPGSESHYAVIGSNNNENAGDLTINGGTVRATSRGGTYTAAIGGVMLSGSAGTVTINGGTVHAIKANFYGCGIGGSGGSVTINGGTVQATGYSIADNKVFGIGSTGHPSDADVTVTISGGTVYTNGIGKGTIPPTPAAGAGTFSTTAGGNAVIISSEAIQGKPADESELHGIIFESGEGKVYGASVIPHEDFTIESGQTLLVPQSTALDISGIHLSNHGKLYVGGALNGTVNGTVYYPLTVTGCTASGDVSTHQGQLYGKAGGTITLTAANIPAGQVVVGWNLSGSTVTVENSSFTMPAGALAASPILEPDSYTITVSASGADVFCNGRPGSSFSVPRLSRPVLLIRAKSGQKITQVLLNGTDITTEVKGGYYTLDEVYGDKTLTVVTADASPAQGKTYTVQGTVRQGGLPVANLSLELRSTLKTTATDGSGRFSFGGVECEKHSLTAFAPGGSIAGYMEFILTEGSAAGFTSSNGVYTVTVAPNDAGLDFSLELASDNTLRLLSVAGIPAGTASSVSTSEEVSAQEASSAEGRAAAVLSSVPRTGDEARPLFWVVLLLAALGALAALLWYEKSRKPHR